MTSATTPQVDQQMIMARLRDLGLDRTSSVVVHASLRSFGHVDGGAEAVCQALTEVCGTTLVVSGSWERTGLPAPPGLVRPDNAFYNAESWDDFDRQLADAVPYSSDLPVDSYLGAISETMRAHDDHVRGNHPLFSFVGIGEHATELVGAQRLDDPLGPLDGLADLDGDVLLLGTDHTSNTTIHLAEQRLGRGLFFRYAKVGDGLWMELPDVSGESHRFDEIEPELRDLTTEVMIGNCRARLIPVRDVLAVTERLILADPAALLCDDAECRCGAALQQRLRVDSGPIDFVVP